jgi:hypothetical protein
MTRRRNHGLWLLPLGLALAAVMPGCSEPNESEFKEGGGEKQGVADPKYAHGTPDTYKQFHDESKKKVAEAAAANKSQKFAPSKTARQAAAPSPPAKAQ